MLHASEIAGDSLRPATNWQSMSRPSVFQIYCIRYKTMQSAIGEETIYSYSTGDTLLTFTTFTLITLSHPVTLRDTWTKNNRHISHFCTDRSALSFCTVTFLHCDILHCGFSAQCPQTQGRSYHRGRGQLPPPPTNRSPPPHQTSGKLLQWHYFYGDSVETLRILRNLL